MIIENTCYAGPGLFDSISDLIFRLAVLSLLWSISRRLGKKKLPTSEKVRQSGILIK